MPVFNDFLVPVVGFFRGPSAFFALKVHRHYAKFRSGKNPVVST